MVHPTILLLSMLRTICRLREIGRGDKIVIPGNLNSEGDSVHSLEEAYHKPKLLHCSLCGHPGSRKAHLKSACQYCSSVTGEGCLKKPQGFKCHCSACNLVQLSLPFVSIFLSIYWSELIDSCFNVWHFSLLKMSMLFWIT